MYLAFVRGCTLKFWNQFKAKIALGRKEKLNIALEKKRKTQYSNILTGHRKNRVIQEN